MRQHKQVVNTDHAWGIINDLALTYIAEIYPWLALACSDLLLGVKSVDFNKELRKLWMNR